MTWHAIAGGATAPHGFQAAGVGCGIKLRAKRDLALILSERPATVAGMVTTNRLAAAPIHLCRPVLRRGKAQAIIANSGNANACTGPQGHQDATAMLQATAEALHLDPRLVLVASTGVIGRPMPLRRILTGIPEAVAALSPRGAHAAAEAILTTDLVTKEVAVECVLDGRPVRIGGMAKGSGMINPSMATMLAFITTDAAVTLSALRVALRHAVAQSFNMITVDGEMSTNDLVVLLANGRSGIRPLQAGDGRLGTFTRALTHVCETLAKTIVRDGEGATRLVTVEVRGAATAAEAARGARTIANSLLVKTMVAGRDPNWGRVAAAVGAAGIRLDPLRMTIALGGLVVFQHGRPERVNPLHLKRAFDHPEVLISIHCGAGSSHARVWSCDLTEGYIRINAKYST